MRLEALNNELKLVGIDIEQMIAEELEELASKLARVAKKQLGNKINPLDLQDSAQEIVNAATGLTSKKNTIDRDTAVEMSIRHTN